MVAVDEDNFEKVGEVEKIALEQDAAGRIMARGFADELDKIAGAREMWKATGDYAKKGIGAVKDYARKGYETVKSAPGKVKNLATKPGGEKYTYRELVAMRNARKLSKTQKYLMGAAGAGAIGGAGAGGYYAGKK